MACGLNCALGIGLVGGLLGCLELSRPPLLVSTLLAKRNDLLEGLAFYTVWSILVRESFEVGQEVVIYEILHTSS